MSERVSAVRRETGPRARRRRRWRPHVGVVAVLATLLLAPGVIDAPARGATTVATSPPLAVPPTGTLFGAFANPKGGQTLFSSLEAQIGRHLDVDRLYASWDTVQPDAQVQWDVANDIIPVLSIRAATTSGVVVPWTQITAGTYDSAIVAQADALAALGAPVILTFDHEPESDPGNGSPADFVAAWQHYVTVVRDQGATNVSFALILEANSYGPTTIQRWYPGDSYVDWVGADGYNRFGCDGSPAKWVDFSTLFSPLENFAVLHGKPAMITEWASAEDPGIPGRKAQWIAAAAQSLESWPQVKASLYFDDGGAHPGCDFPLSSSPSALQAFATMGAQPFFNPRPRAVLTSSPGAGPAPLTVGFDGSGSYALLRSLTAWQLDFGDGSPPASGVGIPPTSVDHVYPAGAFTAELTVSDGSGLEDTTPLVVHSYPPPVVTTGWSTVSGPTTATLFGSVVPGGLPTTVQFVWGTTAAFGQSSPPTAIGAGSSPVEVSAAVTGLQPGTQYFWRVVGTNGGGDTAGGTKSFRTPGSAPGLGGITSSTLSSTSVGLTGAVTPHRLDTQWFFVFGPTSAYDSLSPPTAGDAGSGVAAVPVSTVITGLPPGSTWHFTLVAVNQVGTTVGTDHTFRVAG